MDENISTHLAALHAAWQRYARTAEEQLDPVRPTIDILHTVFDLRRSPILGTRCPAERCRCHRSDAARI